VLAVRGRAERLANARGVTQWHVSLSHTESVAMAVVIAVAGGGTRERR
jgi:phosphopantetheinyl transferase (holo-ACP synthase)